MLHHGKRLAIIHAMACACSFWFASGLLTCLESLLFALVHPPVRSPVAHAVRTTCTSAQALIGGPCPQSDTPQPALNVHLSESCGSLFELPTELTSSKHCSAWRIRLVVYGARLESVLVSQPHEFESRILRHQGFGFCQNPFVIRTHMHIRSGPNMCTIVHIHCFCSGVAWHIFRDDRIPTIFVPQQRIKTRKCDYVAHPNAT